MRTPTSRAAFASVLIAVLATLLPATPAQAQAIDKYERQARVVTNNKREKHDLARLKKQKCVQRFARRQARRMANQERMFHQDLGVVLNKCNLTRVGENVAAGFPTGKAAVRGWMNSDGHRANILEGRYKLLGLAARRGDNGVVYAVQVFGRR